MMDDAVSLNRQSEEATKKALEAQRICEKRIKDALMSLALGAIGVYAFLMLRELYMREMKSSLPPEADADVIWAGMLQSSLRWLAMAQAALAAKDEAMLKAPFADAKRAMAGIAFPESSKVGLAPVTEDLAPIGDRFRHAIVQMAGDEPSYVRSYGERPIGLWPEAEMEVRWGFQKRLLSKATEGPGDLFYISTHLNCSKRCLPDQGKLVSKSLQAVDGDMWTGEYQDGRKVYSLQAMLARTDKYGWHNFILSGFNCRHHLIPYQKGAPIKPPKAEAEEVSEKEQRMRSMERALRKMRSKYEAVFRISSVAARPYYKAWADGVARYEAYALKWGLVPQGWRTV